MKKKKLKQEDLVSKEEVSKFTMLHPLLDSVLNELKELSKKKQDGALNELKVKMVNRILSKVKALLSNDPTVEFLDLLDEEKLPTNSDAVLIIAQFKSAMDQYKMKNTTWKNGSRFWNTGGEDEQDDEDIF